MRRELLLIGEMIDAAEQAQKITAGIDAAQLARDRLRRDAVLWNFTVLGEASSQLDDQVKAEFPDVEWSRPTQLRNRIVHGYWSTDLDILLTTAREDLPGFAAQLRDVLARLESTDS
jgi:uncharacterized protein with HEPN domain